MAPPSFLRRQINRPRRHNAASDHRQRELIQQLDSGATPAKRPIKPPLKIETIQFERWDFYEILMK